MLPKNLNSYNLGSFHQYLSETCFKSNDKPMSLGFHDSQEIDF